jgi:hypothetical protein
MNDKERSNKISVLALRMTLAALREDRTAFHAAFTDFTTIRDAELDANGQSDILYRLVHLLSHSAAGSMLDADDDMERCERFLSGWIAELLDGASP